MLTADGPTGSGHEPLVTHDAEPAVLPSVRWGLVLLSATALLVCTGGPSYFAAAHVWHGADWVTLYPFTAVALVGGVLLYKALAGRPWRTWPLPLFPAAAFCLLALLSAWWTVSPTTTPRAALLGAGIAAFGCWFGWRLEIEEQVTSVMLASATAVLSSIVVVLIDPRAGHALSTTPGQEYGPDWMGIFGNRNSLAAVSALGVIGALGWFGVRPGLVRGVVGTLLVLASGLTLHWSGGDTSVLALGAAVLTGLAVPLLWRLRAWRVPGWLLVGIAVVALVAAWRYVFANIDSLTSMAGRSPMLSSRRVIWADVRAFIRDRPLLGHGYWGLWDRVDLTAATYQKVGSAYGSAHNSLLEVALMMGLVGVVIYLQICLYSIGATLRAAWFHRSFATCWWTALTTYIVVQNLTESFVLWHSYNWVLFVAAGLSAWKYLRVRSTLVEAGTVE